MAPERLDHIGQAPYLLPYLLWTRRQRWDDNRLVAVVTASPSIVGRDAELERLAFQLRQARAGDPRFELVHGEAGIGKSRLVGELALRARDDGVAVLVGGCVDLAGGSLPYGPVVEMLRGLIRDQGATTISGLASGRDELSALLPELGSVAPDLRGFGRTRLFQQFLELLGDLSQRTPMLLIIEDLHWADGSTRDLLSFLLRNLRTERLLLVGTVRNDEPVSPGPQQAWIAGLARHPRVDVLEVPALGRRGTSQQLAGILGHQPAPNLVKAVFARSEGNPFFVEQLAAFGTTAGVPRHLRDLLIARVRRLSERTQGVLRVASAAGYQVDADLVGAVADQSKAAMLAALREAADDGLIVTVGEAQRFRHVLLQEAIYESMLPAERNRLHYRFAERMGKKDLDPALLAVIAQHWDAAGQWTRALLASIDAAAAALRILAYPEAHEQLERALRLWGRASGPETSSGLDRVTLLERAADAAHLAGAAGRAAEISQEAIGLVDPSVDGERAGRLYARLANFLSHAPAPAADAFAAYERAAELLPTAPSTTRARVIAELSRLQARRKAPGAEARAREAIALAHAAGTPGAAAMAHLALSIVALRRGDVDEARILQRRAREAGGTPRETTITYNHEAATLMHAGLFREGLAVARQGEAYATAHGLHRNVGCFLTGNVGDLLYELGRWDEVERLVAEQLRDDINEWARSWFLLLKAQVAVARGSPAVRTHLAEAMATTRHFDSPQEVAPLLVAYAEHLLSAGEPYAARPRAARAYALASEALLQRTRALWVMLRIEGDIASLGALGRAEVPVSVEDEARSLSQRAMPAEVAYGALCEAELTRVAGRPDPLLWAVAAERLDGLESPYRSAYARFRQSEAMLVSGRTRGDDVATILQTAHRIALDLGAAPLVAEITALALRGRILLGSMQHQGGGVSDPLAEYSLSDREVEVLRLLAAGMTNREIGSALFISPKTASVHVSHILAKLQVRSRVQAAGIAHRLGVIAAER